MIADPATERTCTSSIYTATYAQINSECDTKSLISTLGLSTFVLGIGFGPLLTGPLSEYYGRRPIYLVSWSLFIIWTIPSVVAKNIDTMIIARFFNGFAGGTFLSVAGGTVRDVFSRNEIQTPMALVSLAPLVGPSLGPLIGGFINYYTRWRWTYYIVIIWSTIILLSVIFFVLETSAKRENLHGQTRNDQHKTLVQSTKKMALYFLRPFQLLFLEPMCLCLDLFSAILLGILYIFFGAFRLVFQTTYDMNLWQIGLAFSGIITGMFMAAASNPIWCRIRERLSDNQEEEPGRGEPEYQLPPAIIGGVLIPIGLFWFGWTTCSSIHWIIPIIGSALFGCG